MTWEQLPTDYTDVTWNGLRKYVEVQNEDGTVSFQDVTVYTNREKSFFGAKEANQMNAAMNLLAENIESTSEDAESASESAQTASDKATAAGNSATAAANSQSAAASSASTASTKATNAANSATAAANFQTAAANSAAAASESAENAAASAELTAALLYNNPGAHNAIYRGKYLGTAVTDEQYAAIAAGTFDDLYVGDYWTIGGVNWRIAAFDYYYKVGDTSCTTHHVTIVPDTQLYTAQMNTSNVTTGAYVGSAMYTANLEDAKTTINNAFGSAHILNHRQYLQNAVTSGYASAGSWYDSTVELMTEQNVYGCKIFGNGINGTAFPNNYTVDKSQYPLFAHRPDLISNSQWYWLRDVASAANFARVNANGHATYGNASYAYGVRPAFSIIG